MQVLSSDEMLNQYHALASGGVVNNLNSALVQSTTIEIPKNKFEQSKIGTFFKHLDELIALYKQKHEKFQKIKKALLEKMFPKNGDTKPQIRFKGFTDAWERRKLGELCEITTGKLDANAMDKDGINDFYTSGIQKYKINHYAFEGPAITIAGNGATVGYMHYADGRFNAYQRTYVLSSFCAKRKFLFQEISIKLPQKIAQEARSGNIPYIVLEMLTDLKVNIPTNKEQEKIGAFFKHLDKLIALHQCKYEKLQNVKKSLLKKMFV